MNGLSLKELVKNDEKLDSKLKTDLQQITMIMEEQRSQNYSNEKMDEEVYCLYLKKKASLAAGLAPASSSVCVILCCFHAFLNLLGGPRAKRGT